MLTDSPRNTAAAVGQSVTIACKTQNGPVTWRYKNVQTTGQPKTIYLNGMFQEVYASTNITVGTYDLNFAAVQLSDAGSYTCQDNALDGKSAWLTVFGKCPVRRRRESRPDSLFRCDLLPRRWT